MRASEKLEVKEERDVSVRGGGGGKHVARRSRMGVCVQPHVPGRSSSSLGDGRDQDRAISRHRDPFIIGHRRLSCTVGWLRMARGWLRGGVGWGGVGSEVECSNTARGRAAKRLRAGRKPVYCTVFLT